MGDLCAPQYLEHLVVEHQQVVVAVDVLRRRTDACQPPYQHTNTTHTRGIWSWLLSVSVRLCVCVRRPALTLELDATSVDVLLHSVHAVVHVLNRHGGRPCTHTHQSVSNTRVASCAVRCVRMAPVQPRSPTDPLTHLRLFSGRPRASAAPRLSRLTTDTRMHTLAECVRRQRVSQRSVPAPRRPRVPL